ncbi:hypothetical protein GCM10028771_12760 [Nocardioides marmoraquaticus]
MTDERPADLPGASGGGKDGVLQLRRCVDREQWDSAVASVPDALFFHSWDWLDLQERLLGVRSLRLVVLRDGDPVGVVPVFRRRPWSLVSHSPPDVFFGPAVPDDMVSAVRPLLRRERLRRGLLVHRFDLTPRLVAPWEPELRREGASLHDLRTVVVDLEGIGSVDDLRASYSRNHRRSVKHALERDGCSVRDARAGEVAELLPELLHESSTRHGRPFPYAAEVGSVVEEWARGRDDVGLLAADVRGELAGVIVVLGGGRTAIGWVGGCLLRHRDVGVNVLLHHHAIAWALERGHARVDLCGGIGDKGNLKFKLAFGGVVCRGLHVTSAAVPPGLQSRVVRLKRRLSSSEKD